MMISEKLKIGDLIANVRCRTDENMSVLKIVKAAAFFRKNGSHKDLNIWPFSEENKNLAQNFHRNRAPMIRLGVTVYNFITVFLKQTQLIILSRNHSFPAAF